MRTSNFPLSQGPVPRTLAVFIRCDPSALFALFENKVGRNRVAHGRPAIPALVLFCSPSCRSVAGLKGTSKYGKCKFPTSYAIFLAILKKALMNIGHFHARHKMSPSFFQCPSIYFGVPFANEEKRIFQPGWLSHSIPY